MARKQLNALIVQRVLDVNNVLTAKLVGTADANDISLPSVCFETGTKIANTPPDGTEAVKSWNILVTLCIAHTQSTQAAQFYLSGGSVLFARRRSGNPAQWFAWYDMINNKWI